MNIVLDLDLDLDICFMILDLFCVDLDDYFVIDKYI